jgi:magnesium transporter
MFVTMPLGMIVVRDDYFITVCLNKPNIITEFERGMVKSFYTYKKTRFVLQILFKTAAHFLNNLKQINKQVDAAEEVLQKSMKNKELLKLLNLKKSLVYFSTSLKSNEAVMERTLRGRVIKLYEEDEDILEDAIVENKQAIEMCKIYSDILSGSMDAYASIISNNLNIVMKFLAAMTIVLSLPTAVSSFLGMNVPIPYQESEWAFAGAVGLSAVIIIIVCWWLKKKDMF